MPVMKSVVVLGSTGSIGTQTLDVIAQHPDRFKVVGLTAKSNIPLLRAQAERFDVKNVRLTSNPHELVEVATTPDCDLLVVSVAGVVGLLPTIEAIKAGKDVALASKEVLVAAGEIVMPLVKEKGITLTPIDSEHSAIFQCLQGYRYDQVDRLILTASGGPFRGKTRAELEKVTVDEALNHPTWRMGGKITIDSATLMNKALETIEARWLFGVDVAKIDTVIHPQSIVHSFVKFNDGSVLAQLGFPNMKLPIQYALLYPERLPNDLKPWDPLDCPHLTFEAVDHATFPALQLARECMEIGGTAPCAMNAANEEAANGFLKGDIPFLSIYDVVGETMLSHERKDPTLENLLLADEQSRQIARNLMQSAKN